MAMHGGFKFACSVAPARIGEFRSSAQAGPQTARACGSFGEKTSAPGHTEFSVGTGAKGVHASYGGYNLPLQHKPFTQVEDDPWMKPLIENQVEGGWTLYDLRRLRFHKMENVGLDMQRMIDGYDLLVIIPELTPADKLE